MFNINGYRIDILHIIGFMGLVVGLYQGDDFDILFSFIIIVLADIRVMDDKIDELTGKIKEDE